MHRPPPVDRVAARAETAGDLVLVERRGERHHAHDALQGFPTLDLFADIDGDGVDPVRQAQDFTHGRRNKRSAGRGP